MIGKIMTAYAKQKGVRLQELRFSVRGEVVTADNTPNMLGLEDRDHIDVRVPSEDDPITRYPILPMMYYTVKMGTKLRKILDAIAVHSQ
jgi:hypothetical protein